MTMDTLTTSPKTNGKTDDKADVELSPRRVRVMFGCQTIADSIRVKLVFSGPRHFPAYYFPLADVRRDVLKDSDRQVVHPGLGSARYWSVEVGGKAAPEAAWGFPEPLPGAEAIKDHVTFRWNLMDAWFEEDEGVIAHARDPHHRIDVLRSTRRVEVHAGDTLLADTRNSRMLFETTLPVRYYIPLQDVRLGLLSPSETVTACAYKGQTSAYWDLIGGPRDIAWSYAQPSLEVSAVAGLLCFFNERVDISVDGELQDRPHTPWS